MSSSENRMAPPGRGLNLDRGFSSAVRAALAKCRGLADALAEEVELRPSHLAVADDLDLLDAGAVDLERSLDADTTRDPAHRDRTGDATTAQAHNRAFEDLDPLTVALD